MAEKDGLPETPAEDGTSLSDELAKAWDEAESAEEGQETPPKSEEGAQEAQETPPEGEEDQEETEGAEGEGEEQEETPEVDEAPKQWPAADREMYSKLDPDARAFLKRREAEMDTGFQKKIDEHQPVLDAVSNWNPYFQQLGVQPAQAIDTLVRAEQRLRNGTPDEKRQMLLSLAQDYGISLPQSQAATAEGQPSKAKDEPVSPQVAELKQQVDGLQNLIKSRDQAEQTATQNRISAEIREFKSQTTEAGEPVHPFFDDVFRDMVVLATAERQAGRQPDLKTLYDTAVWANPHTRAKLQEKEVADRLAKEAKDREAEEAKKRKASASVTTQGDASAVSDIPASSVREELERGWGA